MSLEQLRKSMAGNLQRLKEEADSKKSNKPAADGRFWKPTFDKEKGTGGAVIRFLPAPNGEVDHFVKVFSHAFQGPTGKWYIENSLSTIGKRDCMSSLGYRLYNSGVESDKAIQKPMKRKVKYYANILVKNDPAFPENNGKVFLFEYGPQIAELLENTMFPPADEIDPKEPIDVFSPWEGADFVIRMYGKTMPGRDGKMITVPSYEKSTFKEPAELADDDQIEAIWKTCYSLQEFIADDKFKSEEDLKKRLVEVLGLTIGSGIPTVEGWAAPAEPVRQAPKAAPVEDFEDVPDFAPTVAPKASLKEEKAVQVPAKKTAQDDDDDIAFLKSLMD
jgi:hypothetical protein